MNDDQWSQDIAILISDALVDGGCIKREQMIRVAEIVAEELLVRFLVEDYPPGALSPEHAGVKGRQ